MNLLESSEDVLKEILLSCDLEDLSLFVFIIHSTKPYKNNDKFRSNDFLDEYMKRNDRYKYISIIGKTKLKYLNYDENINYKELIEYLLSEDLYIKFWNTKYIT